MIRLLALLLSGLCFLPLSRAFMTGMGRFSRIDVATRRPQKSVVMQAGGPKLLVVGGAGFVGNEVCKRAVQKGYQVTSLSRRGLNPYPEDDLLAQVEWRAGDATDLKTVQTYVANADAVVHACGLLFDIESGLSKLNTVVSGSKSLPGKDSTYDNITRRTALNLLQAIKGKFSLPFTGSSERFPLLFISAAEAGWPDVTFGPRVETLAPEWLTKYLAAKRAVESELMASTKDIRPVIFRPSLVWDWGKLDVLPVIPVFNIASAVGVPFVDKTVRVETLADAIVAALDDPSVSGVQRFMQMEELAKRKELTAA